MAENGHYLLLKVQRYSGFINYHVTGEIFAIERVWNNTQNILNKH